MRPVYFAFIVSSEAIAEPDLETKLVSCMISIVVPVYNTGEYLSKCVESILSQSHADIEVLLVDDGSTDGSSQICDEFGRIDARVRVFHQDNAGPSAARNYGIREARGSMIAFVDSDDVISPRMYEVLVARIKETDSDLAICNFFEVTGNRQILIDHGFENSVIEGKDIIHRIIAKHYNGDGLALFSPCNRLYRTEILHKHGVQFDESRTIAEDLFFNLQVLRHGSRVTFMKESLYYYMRNSSSLMHRFYRNQLQRWEQDDKELLEMNAEYFRLDVDFDRYYRFYISNGIHQMIDAYAQSYPDRAEIVSEYENSAFFLRVIQHSRLAPKYAKLVCLFIRNKQRGSTRIALRTFAVIKKMKHLSLLPQRRTD